MRIQAASVLSSLCVPHMAGTPDKNKSLLVPRDAFISIFFLDPSRSPPLMTWDMNVTASDGSDEGDSWCRVLSIESGSKSFALAKLFTVTTYV